MQHLRNTCNAKLKFDSARNERREQAIEKPLGGKLELIRRKDRTKRSRVIQKESKLRNDDDHRSEDIHLRQMKKKNMKKKFRLEWDSNPRRCDTSAECSALTD